MFPEERLNELQKKHPEIMRCNFTELNQNLLALMSRGVPKSESLDLSIEMAALNLWKQHKNIYDISPELSNAFFDASASQTSGDSLPASLLQNLSYKCIAIRGAPIEIRVDNRFHQILTGNCLVLINHLPNNPPMLTGLFETTDGSANFVAKSLALLPNGKICECVDSMLKDQPEEYPPDFYIPIEVKPMLYIAQIVLYLQSSNADVQRVPAQKKSSHAKKRSKPPRKYNVGFHVGRTIQSQRLIYEKGSQSRHASPSRRPHMRCAHWHSFWVGKHDAPDRKLIVKWLPPTFVSGTKAGDDMPTVHKVK